jgi:DNA-cytosine methyltransferase
MVVLSCFDGMSVARQALKQAGLKVDKYYASEIDKYATSVAQSNYPETIQLGSITESEGWDLPKIDLMIGGSPCQDLSIAKKNRQGLSGSRSGLFWDFINLRDKLKPTFFILENVASMPKDAKDIISEAVGCEPIMINASLVSAQNRKRLFWVCKWNGSNYEKVEVEQPEDRGILLRDILEPKVDEKYYIKDKSNTVRASGRNSGIDDRHNWDTIRIGSLNSGGQGDRVYSKDGKSVALSANGYPKV